MAASDNTFSEAMQKILQSLAIAATLPDADVEFCATMQAQITQKLREDAGGSGAVQQQAGNPAMGGGAPPFGPSAGGAPMQGLTPSAPNMDEIRRMVGAGGAVQ